MDSNTLILRDSEDRQVKLQELPKNHIRALLQGPQNRHHVWPIHKELTLEIQAQEQIHTANYLNLVIIMKMKSVRFYGRPWDCPTRAGAIHFVFIMYCHSFHISWNTICEEGPSAAWRNEKMKEWGQSYPGRPGSCSSPASRLCTGFSEQHPAVPTPPGRSPLPPPQRSLTPEITHTLWLRQGPSLTM